ncbi:hypothetical protein XF24_00289 [candidate division SR1 bacterium Aalborg_AAW-1]|nr:hypothetical protein XF24_00289 [candidate division SR1 bacterium Aalborg_AAW-1]
MRIFSSFDTRYKKKLLSDKQLQYGSDKVLLVEKSGLFLFVKVYFPIIISLLVGLVTGLSIDYFLETQTIRSVLTGSLMALFMLIPYRIFKHYIDYHMDYCLITPTEIILAEQSGIFKRQIRTLDASKIKSISVHKKHVLKSIFNNGVILFLSDGDDNNLGEINIDYIYNPEAHKEKINAIMNESI